MSGVVVVSVEVERDEMKQRLQNIDPYEFEQFVGDLWEEEGWSTTVSQESNDLGVDVIADKSGAINQRLAIQAKRYSEGNKVGRPKVQQYHSLKQQDTNADAAVVVTTSGFTKDARLWAHDHNVKLVDGGDLVDMVVKHGADDLVEEYAPSVEKIDSGATAKSSPSSTSSSLSSSSSLPVSSTGNVKWVVLATLLSGGGLTLAISPSIFPLLSADAGVYLFTAGWFTAPVFVFLDALGLHRNDSKTKPNRIIWPGLAFFIPVLGTLWYLMNRA
jgi:hypothetical protein